MATPTQPLYNCIDDYGQAAGQAGSPGGGASGEVLFGPFSAPTIASAVTVAHIVASAAQRPVRLQPVGSPPPYTLVQGVAATVAITACPSGIGY